MGNLGSGMGTISDEDFDDVFNMFDKDKSGTVEKDEMVDFIKHFLGDQLGTSK
jgi:Ca2+-binding EF-hand superfamily protein